MKKLLLLTLVCVFAQVKTEQEIPEMTDEQRKKVEEIEQFIKYWHTTKMYKQTYPDKNDSVLLWNTHEECTKVDPWNLNISKRRYNLFEQNRFFKENILKVLSQTSKELDKYFITRYGIEMIL